jgi:hypothetical protein
LPNRAQYIRRDKQNDEFVGICRQNIRHRDEVKNADDRKRQKSGYGEIHRSRNPPPRHPNQKADTASNRIRQRADRPDQQRSKDKRSARNMEQPEVRRPGRCRRRFRFHGRHFTYR